MKTMPRKPAQPRTSELYAFRTRKGWTQEEMAAEMGVSRATLQRLERLPALPTLYRRAFDGIKATAK